MPKHDIRREIRAEIKSECYRHLRTDLDRLVEAIFCKRIRRIDAVRANIVCASRLDTAIAARKAERFISKTGRPCSLKPEDEDLLVQLISIDAAYGRCPTASVVRTLVCSFSFYF